MKNWHGYLRSPPPTDTWYRIVDHKDRWVGSFRFLLSITLSPHGIEIPNAECAYIQSRTTTITEEQAQKDPRLHEEYPHQSRQSLGYKIITENGTHLYWHDIKTSQATSIAQKQEYYIFRFLELIQEQPMQQKNGDGI